MNFGDCLQAAVNAGELDPERAKLAQEEWEGLARRYEDSGVSSEVVPPGETVWRLG